MSHKNYINKKIIDLIKKSVKINIADISKQLNIKRSTLIYYLKELEIKGYINKKRIENQKGRPTIYEINISN